MPSRTTIDGLGPGVFRKVRRALGVTAFGVNAVVLPAGTEWFAHTHDLQDELYFVHRGRAGFEVDDERFELEEGGLVHVEAGILRQYWNAGESDLVLLIAGGRNGYVERDGRIPDPEQLERRQAFSRGDATAIVRRR